MKETPHGWVIVKITDKFIDTTTPIYKVFASWRGGYLEGDSWKMNSGIKSVEETETDFIFHGYSGSEYHCNKQCYGSCTSYTRMVLENMIKEAWEHDYLIEKLPQDFNFKEIGE
jgi:hypothetical protein